MAEFFTLEADTQGYDAIFNSNVELANLMFAGMLDDDAEPTGSISVASLTDSTGGTPGLSLVDVTASHDQAKLNDNFATLNAKVDAILGALRITGGTGILADEP